MIHEAAVLLRVKHFQQCGRSIALVIAADLINLIQENQRIVHTCIFQCGRQSARQRTDIRTSVSANLCFIPHSAKTNTHITLVQRACDGACNGGLTGSGRSHQTENRAFAFRCQTADCKEFQHSVLHLFQTVMLVLEYLLCALQVQTVRVTLIPRESKQGLDIATGYRTFGGASRDTLKMLDFLTDFLLHGLVRIQCLTLFQIHIRICHRITLTKLLADDLHLLTHDVFLLVLIYLFLHLRL